MRKKSRNRGSKGYKALRKLLIAAAILSGLFSEVSNVAAVLLLLSVLGLAALGMYSYFSPKGPDYIGKTVARELNKYGQGADSGQTAASTVTRKAVAAPTLDGKGLKRLLSHPGKEEETPHSTGKGKYLEQLDSFLKNGLIDRQEYQALKARYQALDISPEGQGSFATPAQGSGREVPAGTLQGGENHES